MVMRVWFGGETLEERVELRGSYESVRDDRPSSSELKSRR